MGEEKGFKGVVDLVQMKAHIYQTDGSGKSTESAIPADFTARSQEYRDKLVEAVAESDEKLMEKFFDSGSLTDEELIAGLKKQVAEGKDLSRVVFVRGRGNIGIQHLLNSIREPATRRRRARNRYGKGYSWQGNPAEDFRQRAILRICVQNVFRSIYRKNLAVSCFIRNADSGTSALQRQQKRDGTLRFDRFAAGKNAGPRAETSRRRYRRGGEAERNA